jgi:hypothetical protein
VGQEDVQYVCILLDTRILTACTTEYHIYVTINFNIPHCLHLRQHLPELLGNPAPELQDLHGLLKIHLWIKVVDEVEILITMSSSVFEKNIICVKYAKVGHTQKKAVA